LRRRLAPSTVLRCRAEAVLQGFEAPLQTFVFRLQFLDRLDEYRGEPAIIDGLMAFFVPCADELGEFFLDVLRNHADLAVTRRAAKRLVQLVPIEDDAANAVDLSQCIGERDDPSSVPPTAL
jgi:hypothetical protein